MGSERVGLLPRLLWYPRHSMPRHKAGASAGPDPFGEAGSAWIRPWFEPASTEHPSVIRGQEPST